MRHLLYLLVLCLALLCQNIEARNSAGRVAESNDFYYNENKQAITDGSGMGDDEDDSDGSGSDEDQEDAEGSASEPVAREKTCIDKVQESRDSGLLGAYVPQCDEDGSYSKVQCHGSIGMCWCADEKGEQVDGTKTRGVPVCEDMVYSYNIVARFDIDYNTVAKNVDLYKMKIKKKLMMSFEKKFRGNTVALIINSVSPGSVVVDMDLKVSGVQAKEPTTSDLKEAVTESSVGPLLDMASEPRHTTTPPTPAPETTKMTSKRTTPQFVIKSVRPNAEDDNDQEMSTDTAPTQSNVVPGADNEEGSYEVREDDSKEDREEDTNEVEFEQTGGQIAASTGLVAHPGLLAGVIGGAVVGLLFAVLLVMFIVYRMRKKDEGSYALDEPKTPRLNTSYTKAPTKEFYA